MSLGQILNYVPNMYAYRKRYQFGGGRFYWNYRVLFILGLLRRNNLPQSQYIHTIMGGLPPGIENLTGTVLCSL